jgi:hypothetical protein
VLRDNTVFISKKNVMSYVLAVVSQFSQGSAEVKVKARGRSIVRTLAARFSYAVWNVSAHFLGLDNMAFRSAPCCA